MGCGASVARGPASVGALDAGELRDASLPPTVVLHQGVAQAGARTHIATAATAATADTADTAAPGAAAAAPPAVEAATAGVTAGSQPKAVAAIGGTGGGGSSRSKDGDAGSGTAPDTATAAAAAAATAEEGLGGTWLLVDVPARAADPTAATAATEADTGEAAATATAAAAAAAITATTDSAAEAEPAIIVGEVGVGDAAAPATASASSAAAAATASASSAAVAAAATAEPAEAPQPPQPRMVDCAVSLQFLVDFSAGQVPEDMPTWKVVTDIVVPATRDRRCRYVEHIDNRHVGHCDYFISHRWATPFSHLVRYARKHLVELGDVVLVPPEAAVAAGGGDGSSGSSGKEFTVPEGKRRADQVFVWCDIFAINQHPSQVQADDLAQLKDCVEASAQTLLCLDDKGLVLTRIWCLYEIWNTVLAGGPPKLAVLGYDVNEAAFKEVYITLDVAEAQATVEADRVRILDDIAASTGLQELNLVLKDALVASTQHEAEYAQRVLMPRIRRQEDATVVNQYIVKHVQMLNNVGRHVESARYSQLLKELGEQMAAIFRKQQQQLVDSGGGEATAAGAAEVEEEAEWHWSHYPRDAALRKIFARAKEAAGGGRYEEELAAYREALAQAEAAVEDSSKTAAAAAAALDAAGCRLAVSTCLKRQGYNSQAAEGVEAALVPFEAHAPGGATGLSYASAAHAVALLLDNNWEKKDRIAQLLQAAYDIQAAQLGAAHAATLATLEARAKAAMFGGDVARALELNHQLCLGLSSGGGGGGGGGGGLDLTTAEEGPATHAAVAKLSIAALDAWRTYLTFLVMPQYGGGRDEGVVRACRLLLPPRRRQQIRMARQAVAQGPGSEYLEQSQKLLQVLSTLEEEAAASSAATAATTAAAGGATAEPAALLDPDDTRLDCGIHLPELTTWANALAGQGDGEAAVRMHWRIADVLRQTEYSSMTYGATKLSLVEAYEQGVILDTTMPGAANLARAMLAKRDNPNAAAATAAEPAAATTANAADGSGSQAAAPASGDGAGAASGGGASSGGGAASGAAAGTTAAAGTAAPYDGPSYGQLVKELTSWSEDISKTGEPDYERFVQIQRQMWACLAATHGIHSSQAVQARASLAQAIDSTGRREEAVAEMRATLADHEQMLGGKDPLMVHTLTQLANMLDDRAEGEALHRRAVALVEKVLGPNHQEVGSALQGLGGYIMSGDNMDRFKEGQALMTKGSEIVNKFMEEQNAKSKAF